MTVARPVIPQGAGGYLAGAGAILVYEHGDWQVRRNGALLGLIGRLLVVAALVDEFHLPRLQEVGEDILRGLEVPSRVVTEIDDETLVAFALNALEKVLDLFVRGCLKLRDTQVRDVGHRVSVAVFQVLCKDALQLDLRPGKGHLFLRTIWVLDAYLDLRPGLSADEPDDVGRGFALH